MKNQEKKMQPDKKIVSIDNDTKKNVSRKNFIPPLQNNNNTSLTSSVRMFTLPKQAGGTPFNGMV